MDRTIRASVAALVFTLIAAFAGCGGDSEPAGAPAERSDAQTLVASLGDSITAGTPLWDPNPAIRAQIGPEQLDPKSEYGYWAERANPRAEFRNCGVAGERTDEIARRLDDCARGADALIVQGGVNDIAQGREPAAIAPHLRAMVKRGKASGLDVAIVELLPWNGGYPQAAGEIRALNRLIARIAEAEGVELIRWYRVLENPEQPGRMKLDLTIDLAHPSVRGYRLLGEAVEVPGP